MPCPPLYIATVGLDPNRWGSREPSFAVSEWLSRFAADGFDGVELWEFHDQLASDEERAKLREKASPLAIYNTYVTFNDDAEEAARRDRVAQAIAELGAGGVKYNVVRDAERLDENRRNVIAWAQTLPDSCRLLCECHPGTPLETPEAAAAFFDGLDPARFGIIVHFNGEAEPMKPWLETFGSQVQHVHIQSRTPENDPTRSPGKDRLEEGVALLADSGYGGSVSIEFTRGMGRDETIENVYANMLADMTAFREAW